MASSISPFIDWDILTWLRGLTSLPIVIKGIQCVEDAVLAYENGVQGIVLSNHGGRSQDTYVDSPSTPYSVFQLTRVDLNRPFSLFWKSDATHPT